MTDRIILEYVKEKYGTAIYDAYAQRFNQVMNPKDLKDGDVVIVMKAGEMQGIIQTIEQRVQQLHDEALEAKKIGNK